LRSDLTCEKCSATSFWQVRALRERARHGLEKMGVVVNRVQTRAPSFPGHGLALYEDRWQGHYEILVCRQCGFSAWYARALIDTKDLLVVSHACRDCGHGNAFSVDVYERNAKDWFDEPVHLRVVRKGFPKFWDDGRFAALICCECGRVDWSVKELTVLEPDPSYGLSAEVGQCASCHEGRLWRIGPISELGRHGAQPLGIDYNRKGEPVGVFWTLACRSCGFCEWYAKDHDRLCEDREQGIVPVEKLTTGGGPSGGPYR
jgi:predicted nucleic-acid-binding Zn-ribbon protein